MKSKTDLSGMWEFCLDGDKKGMEQEFYNRHFSDTIALPGTTSEAKKGGRREKREIGVRQDMKKKADIAFKEMETEMMKVIKNDPQSAEQLKDILTRAKERMMEDD